MSTPVASILRKYSRNANEPLRILTAPTHEAYETLLSRTNAIFYAYKHKAFKGWNTKYRPLPDNYILLDGDGPSQIPADIDFDLVLSQNKFGQYQVLRPIAEYLHLPFISLEHTLPMEWWPMSQRQQLWEMQGDANIFISDYSAKKWGFAETPHKVIHHGIDTQKFEPLSDEDQLVAGIQVEKHILSVVNDWINRDHCCNYSGWKRITEGLPVKVIGDTPGLSQPAPTVDRLVGAYQTSQIFLNTSTVSPVPTALLEAMACGCAVVTTATCMIPSIIEHGKNGMISNDEAELRSFCLHLLNEPELCAELGANARKTIEEHFSEKAFIDNWNKTFRETADIHYA